MFAPFCVTCHLSWLRCFPRGQVRNPALFSQPLEEGRRVLQLLRLMLGDKRSRDSGDSVHSRPSTCLLCLRFGGMPEGKQVGNYLGSRFSGVPFEVDEKEEGRFFSPPDRGLGSNSLGFSKLVPKPNTSFELGFLQLPRVRQFEKLPKSWCLTGSVAITRLWFCWDWSFLVGSWVTAGILVVNLLSYVPNLRRSIDSWAFCPNL